MHHRTHSTSHSPRHSDLERAGDLLRFQHPHLVISKRKLREADAIQMVRRNWESEAQNLGFSSRPFVLCGLPVKRPPRGCLLHERRNGRFVLQVTGHPSYGLPWGQDRLVPIFLATMAVRQQSARITFNSAAEMLDTFGIQQGGSPYRRLVASFQRVIGHDLFRLRHSERPGSRGPLRPLQLHDKPKLAEKRNALSTSSREAAIGKPGEQVEHCRLAERVFAASRSVGIG